MSTTTPADGALPVPHRAEHHLPAGAKVADGRGLTATGAVTVALLAGLAGGTYDVLTGVGLRGAFTVCFVLGCAVAAYKVHREDLLAAIVIPPLVYAVLVGASAVFRDTGGTGSLVSRQALELFTELVLNARTLLAASAAAVAIALARLATARRG